MVVANVDGPLRNLSVDPCLSTSSLHLCADLWAPGLYVPSNLEVGHLLLYPFRHLCLYLYPHLLCLLAPAPTLALLTGLWVSSAVIM